MEMKFKPGVLIACIIRGNEIIIPGGHDSIGQGDNVIVVTTMSVGGIGELFS